MTKYIKTGTTEFEQFDGSDEMCEKYGIHPDMGTANVVTGETLYFLVPTLEGELSFEIGDWIATGVNGEHWPVKDEIFQKTYKKLPVIPKVWGDTIEKFKAGETDMDVINVSSVILGAVDYDQSNYIVADWIKEHGDDFARTWLDDWANPCMQTNTMVYESGEIYEH